MTCEVAKQLLGLISSPTNWWLPAQTLWPLTQTLQIAFQPLKPSQEVPGSLEEELPRCAFSGQPPRIKSLGKGQENRPLTGSSFGEVLTPGAKQGWLARGQGASA